MSMYMNDGFTDAYNQHMTCYMSVNFAIQTVFILLLKIIFLLINDMVTAASLVVRKRWSLQCPRHEGIRTEEEEDEGYSSTHSWPRH
jgi:hypothetical protein